VPARIPSRRDFLRLLAAAGASVALGPLRGQAAGPGGATTVPARYWSRIPGTRRVRCDLCPRREALAPGETGFCLSRRNQDGALVTDAWNRPCVMNVEPIGMNPAANFLPGLTMLALGHAGCNLRCSYCQNADTVFQSPRDSRNVTPFRPERVAGRLRRREIGGVTFSFSDPAVSPEFVMAFAGVCGELGLRRAMCTAGYIRARPLSELLKHIDCVTVTYKGPTEAFYREVTGATLAPVLASMRRIRESGTWLEVATLVVPTLNDDGRSLRSMATWIRRNLGPDTPWHLERFEPAHRLRHLPPTPRGTLERARAIGLDAGLRYVYITNLAPHAGNHTTCPACGRVVVRRSGFQVIDNALVGGACPGCRSPVSGVWA
jgi:pyruvate formate lyase activating enzyme